MNFLTSVKRVCYTRGFRVLSCSAALRHDLITHSYKRNASPMPAERWLFVRVFSGKTRKICRVRAGKTLNFSTGRTGFYPRVETRAMPTHDIRDWHIQLVAVRTEELFREPRRLRQTIWKENAELRFPKRRYFHHSDPHVLETENGKRRKTQILYQLRSNTTLSRHWLFLYLRLRWFIIHTSCCWIPFEPTFILWIRGREESDYEVHPFHLTD